MSAPQNGRAPTAAASDGAVRIWRLVLPVIVAAVFERLDKDKALKGKAKKKMAAK